MIVNRITVNRRGYYYGSGTSPKGSEPFECTVEVGGDRGKVELRLSPELSERVVAVIAEEVAAAGRATAEAMTADVMSLKALPSAKVA